MHTMGINKQFDDMWFSRRGKAEVARFKSFTAVSAKRHVATLVIARFIYRYRQAQALERARAEFADTRRCVSTLKLYPFHNPTR